MKTPDNRARPRVAAAAGFVLAVALGAQAADGTLTPEQAASRDAWLKDKPALQEQLRKLEEQGARVRWDSRGPAPAEAERRAAETAYRQGDYRSAIERYEALAAQGDAQAAIILGTMYEEGRGVRRDGAMAYAWYGRAAAMGDRTAQEIVRGMNDRDDLSDEEYRKAQENFEEIARKLDEDFDPENTRRKFEDVRRSTNVNTRTYDR
jgi:TPR repeat protein